MIAISLWQPWATAIALGYKRIETRHWSTHHRGPIAIHAAKRWQTDERDFAEVMARHHGDSRLHIGCPFGAIVAIAKLVDVRRSEPLRDELTGSDELLWGNYADRRFGWVFTDIRPLTAPIPFRGMQGLFEVPDDLVGHRSNDPAQGNLL